MVFRFLFLHNHVLSSFLLPMESVKFASASGALWLARTSAEVEFDAAAVGAVHISTLSSNPSIFSIFLSISLKCCRKESNKGG